MTLFNLNLVTRIAQLQSGPRPAQVWPMTGAPIFHPCPQNRIKIRPKIAAFSLLSSKFSLQAAFFSSLLDTDLGLTSPDPVRFHLRAHARDHAATWPACEVGTPRPIQTATITPTTSLHPSRNV